MLIIPDADNQGVSLHKTDMPQDFTICCAFKAEAYTRKEANSVYLYWLNNDINLSPWSHVRLTPMKHYTVFDVKLGKVRFEVSRGYLLFPLTWTRMCVSLDTVSGLVKLVVDKQLLEEKIYLEATDVKRLVPRYRNKCWKPV